MSQGAAAHRAISVLYRAFSISESCVKGNIWKPPFVLWVSVSSQALLDELTLSFPSESHGPRNCCIHVQVNLFYFVINQIIFALKSSMSPFRTNSFLWEMKTLLLCSQQYPLRFLLPHLYLISLPNGRWVGLALVQYVPSCAQYKILNPEILSVYPHCHVPCQFCQIYTNLLLLLQHPAEKRKEYLK